MLGEDRDDANDRDVNIVPEDRTGWLEMAQMPRLSVDGVKESRGRSEMAQMPRVVNMGIPARRSIPSSGRHCAC